MQATPPTHPEGSAPRCREPIVNTAFPLLHTGAAARHLRAPALRSKPLHCALLLMLPMLSAAAQGVPVSTVSAVDLDTVKVVGRRRSTVGGSISASEGVVAQVDIAARPMLRTGDLLERVPGLVATQHSGSGKANQYFLRGFNLDHGTDFATFVDGMPVNMRTHGHGQGWTDLNFLIPEAVEELTYRKGTYYADVGDFSSAGTARFAIADTAPRQLGLTVGEDGYRRGVIVHSSAIGKGQLLLAGELQGYDGPWRDVEEDVYKRSGLLRYSVPQAGGQAHVMLMTYANRWNSPDQVPLRAVDRGTISGLGSLDRTVGGEASRHSLSAGWSGALAGGTLDGDIYAITSRLNLWSNFTYFLEDPVQGDQFEQVDERSLYGLTLSQQWDVGRSRWRMGVETRHDDIDRVGLFRTVARRRLSTVREDAVAETSVGIHLANEYRFNDRWRSYIGVRRDLYRFDVDSSLPVNSGQARAAQTSYKASLAYQPLQAVELYASAGTGFHSNDARGTTLRQDPVTGKAARPVDALVASAGAELGSRLYINSRLHATLALWTLRLDSELRFVGDAGTTEASRPSRRRGIEAGVYWFGTDRHTANLEVSYSRSRFSDADPAGNSVPGSIPLVVSAGVTGRYARGWIAGGQLKHFGRYPLIEDGSTRSDGSTILNLRIGREWDRHGVFVDVLNVLDSNDHDVDYLYASRLQDEPAGGVEDVHYHVFPPRSIRVALQYRF